MSEYELDPYGTEIWRNEDYNYHREDGPAIISFTGLKQWFINGERHRLDGPAIEYNDGSKEWFYKGKIIHCESQEEFLRLIKMRAFW